MIRCPNCGTMTKELRYRGVIAIGEGSLTVDPDGRIVALGPVATTVVIKAGEELRAKNMSGICTKCKTEAPLSSFQVVRVCPLSGGVAEVELDLGFMTLWVASSQVDLARTVFSARNAEWRSVLPEGIV
jgi:hypothetical protein